MPKNSNEQISRFMSLVLRHQPELIGAKLEDDGWLDAKILLTGIRTKFKLATMDTIREVVDTSDKKRYSFSDDGKKIRAVQGHSVNLEGSTVTESKAPDLLYHGTAYRFLNDIMKDGLRPQSRLHVHLSTDHETALAIGRRHGTPVVLLVGSDYSPALKGGASADLLPMDRNPDPEILYPI